MNRLGYFYAFVFAWLAVLVVGWAKGNELAMVLGSAVLALTLVFWTRVKTMLKEREGAVGHKQKQNLNI